MHCGGHTAVGVDIWALVHRSAPAAAAPAPAHWLAVAQRLQLAADQCRKMAFVRREHTAKVQGILAARQMLNLEAVSVMLPQVGARLRNIDLGCASAMQLGCVKCQPQRCHRNGSGRLSVWHHKRHCS